MSNRLIADLEAALYLAWPAAETFEHDGWVLRYGDGFSRRINSATVGPVSPAATPVQLDVATEWLGRRGQPLVVRVHDGSADGIDADLAGLGLSVEAPTSVMVREIGPGDGDAGVDLREAPRRSWKQAQRAWFGMNPAGSASWETVLGRIGSPRAFAETVDDRRTIAAGLAVARGTWLGLFEVVVAPGERRRGLATGLVSEMCRWGRSQGARLAFLQVVLDNAPGVAFWESVGFESAYTYWYRRPAG